MEFRLVFINYTLTPSFFFSLSKVRNDLSNLDLPKFFSL